MDGLGVPLALQVSALLSPGARTRFLGTPSIQYGAAEKGKKVRVRELITESCLARFAALHEAIGSAKKEK